MSVRNLTRRDKKKVRISKKIFGDAERPRITVYRSLKQVYAQMIDDNNGVTLASASSLSKEIAEDIKNSKDNLEKGKAVGKLLAKKALDKGIKTAVFDRSGYRYHGRVKAVAEGVREGGVKV